MYKRDMNDAREEEVRLFAVLWGALSSESRFKVCEDGFDPEGRDPEMLLERIRKTHLITKLSGISVIDQQAVRDRFARCRMGENEHLAEFVKRYVRCIKTFAKVFKTKGLVRWK
jgi:hypothetical protein